MDREGGVEGGGDLDEGTDGEVLVAGFYAGEHGLGGKRRRIIDAGFTPGLWRRISTDRTQAGQIFLQGAGTPSMLQMRPERGRKTT